jgi:putative inorganic carbon (HCO3(-)) transporter
VRPANTSSQYCAGDLSVSTSANSSSTQRIVPRRATQAGAYISLLLFMVIYFARPGDWIPGLSVVPLAKITAILALLALVFSTLHSRKKLPREVFYLLLLVGQLFLAAGLSPVWRGGAVQSALAFAKILILVVIMALVVTTAARLRQLIFVQAASVAVIALVTVLKGHLILGRLEGTLGGSYADPNDLALAIIISLPMCLALLFLTRSLLWKAPWAAAILVMLYAVLSTGSRGGLIALIAAAATFLWEFAIRGRRRYLLVFAGLLGMALWTFSGGILVERFRETFSPNKVDTAAYDSAQARRALFWRSVEVTMEHPLFGVGPGNFMQVSGDWHMAHNSFTQMSSEGGIPALIFYLMLLGSGFKNIRTTKKFAKEHKGKIILAKALRSSLIGYIAGSVFLSVNYAFFPYFLVAYTTSLSLIAMKSTPLPRKPKASPPTTLPEELSADIQGLERRSFHTTLYMYGVSNRS